MAYEDYLEDYEPRDEEESRDYVEEILQDLREDALNGDDEY